MQQITHFWTFSILYFHILTLELPNKIVLSNYTGVSAF